MGSSNSHLEGANNMSNNTSIHVSNAMIVHTNSSASICPMPHPYLSPTDLTYRGKCCGKLRFMKMCARCGEVSSGYQQDIARLSQEKLNQSQPITEFPQFKDLPFEIRLQIWREAAFINPRLIQIEWDVTNHVSLDSHYFYRPAFKSRRPPAILQVCHESRTETMRFYPLVNFATIKSNQNRRLDFPNCGPTNIYFNAEIDIVTFSTRSCNNTIVRCLEDLNRAGVVIQRVAIELNATGLNCHDWDKDDRITGPDPWLCGMKYAVAGGCNPIQAIHGIGPSFAGNDMVAGLREVNDVFWIVSSSLLPLGPGDIDESVGLRPAVGRGLYGGDIAITRFIAREIEDINDDDSEYVNWKLDGKPRMEFVSFAPHAAAGKVFDSLVVTTTQVTQLYIAGYHILKKFSGETGCHIKISKNLFIEPRDREVGFYGTPSQVAVAKRAVEELLSSVPEPCGLANNANNGFRSSKMPDVLVSRRDAAYKKSSGAPVAARKY